MKLNRHLKLYPKQWEAFEILQNNHTTELLYGGAAGGAKTFLGCAWQIINRLKYPNTRGFIARAQAKQLYLTTLQSFHEVAAMFGLKANKHYRVDLAKNLITFQNGSQIVLRALAHLPSDPDYARLGSLEITDAFIDEASEITERAAAIVSSRIRYKLTEVQKPAKLLLTCNPSKNWLYEKYYLLAQQGKLPPYRAFVPALLSDNKNEAFQKQYRSQLEKLDTEARARLLYGSWDFVDEQNMLFSSLQFHLLKNEPIHSIGESYFITADVARFGEDSTVIGLWRALHIEHIKVLFQSDLKETAKIIKQWQQQFRVSPRNIIIDADGVGAGVVDLVPNAQEFHGNAKPIPIQGKEQAFKNLKTQCYFKLAEKYAQGAITISASVWQQSFLPNMDFAQQLLQELGAIRKKANLLEGKIALNAKNTQKQLIGRSPDLADMLMMRMLSELQNTQFIFN